jgi:EmrB/QacA subfamily drug resistance transporter
MEVEMSADQSTSAGERGLPYKWRVLISVIFGVFMVILDATVINVALRTLQSEFSADTARVQWVISVYTLALGIITPLSGFMADRFGIKTIYILSLLAFVTGSALCGIAPNLELLVAARALQGLGGGMALPLGTAMLFAAFPPQQRGLALGIFGIALVFAPASGPLIGGALVDHGLWRWIFFLNIPIGLVGAVLSILLLREGRSARKPRFDWPGFLLSTVGFGAVLYGASVAGEQGVGWTATQVLGSLLGGAVVLALFFVVELYVPEPLLNVRLFAKPTFLVANLIGYVSVVALFGAEFLLPLYLQVLRGQTAFQAGLLLLPLAIASGFVAPFSGQLLDRIGPRPLVAAGFALLAYNTYQLSQLTLNTSFVFLIWLLVVRGVALGLVIQSTQVAALADVPDPELPRGSSLINATRQTFQSIGVAILATVLASAVTVQGPPPNVDLKGPIPPAILPLVHQFESQYLTGLEHAYTVTFVAALIAVALALLLPGWPGRSWARKEREMAQAGDASAAVVTADKG